MKTSKFIILAFLMLLPTLFLSCKKEEPKNDAAIDDTSNMLSVEISTDKNIYGVNDEIRLSLTLKNISDESIHLCANKRTNIARFIKVGLATNSDVTYTGSPIIFESPLKEKSSASFLSLKPEETIEGIMFLKISPIKRLTAIPYETKKIFIELNITKENYPENIEAHFTKITGEIKSNEVAIEIDSTDYQKRFIQFVESDYNINYYKYNAENTDQFIVREFKFGVADEVLEKDIGDLTKVVKAFKQNKPFMPTDVLFEFYSKAKLMAYARLIFKGNSIAEFVVFRQNGQVDIRYEFIEEEDGTKRWDKYSIDYLEGTDTYLGYMKIARDEKNSWISELLMFMGDGSYKKFEYDGSGRSKNSKETPAPINTVGKKRKY
ncbi:hypothetical protein ACFL2A_05700 [Thermodesulfobacteriota bacterium]